MNKRRVVVTGIGAVTPLGNNTETTWNNIKSGVSGVGPLTRLNADEYPAKVAAEVKDFNPEDFFDKKDARKMDRFTHYAVASSMMAVRDANLQITDENAHRIGVWIGSGIGGMETFENQYEIFMKRGYRRVIVQGEGGIHIGNQEFLAETEKLCKEYGALLIVDEIQTGIGRTGKAFGFQHFDLAPDIVTAAKGLGSGMPIGAVIN